jgi:hypothetical protein
MNWVSFAGDGTGRAINGIRESDVTWIKPISEEMNGLFGLQQQILNKEQGIEDNDEDFI